MSPDSNLMPFAFGISIAGIMLIGLIACRSDARRERQRYARILEAAKGLGLEPGTVDSEADDSGTSPQVFGTLDKLEGIFSADANAKVLDYFVGRRGEADWSCYTYAFVVSAARGGSTTIYTTIIAAKVPLVLKRLEIRPQTIGDRVHEALGVRDIQFESEAFNKRYYIACEETKFAYDIICPEMIDFLLSIKRWCYQFQGNYITITAVGRLEPETIKGAISAIEGVIQRIPDYVSQDIAAVPE